LLGAESEVDSLNFKLKTLSQDIAGRIVLDEAGNDHFLTIKQLTNEREKLEDNLSDAYSNLEDSKGQARRLQSLLSASQVEVQVSKENLAVVKALLKKEEGDEKVSTTMVKLQQIWEEVGIDGSLREDAQKRIEFCLENTCVALLDAAAEKKCSIEAEIDGLSHRLCKTKAALGHSTEENHKISTEIPLTQTLKELREQLTGLEVPYRFAAARRQKIVEGVTNLSEILELSTSNLHQDLKLLLQHSSREEVNKKCLDTEDEIDDAHEILPANSLETEFLTRCEGHISELRVVKSETLLKSRELQQKIAILMGEMHLNENQSLDLIRNWIRGNDSNEPDWWDLKSVEGILSGLANSKYLSSSSLKLSQHLELMCKAISNSANSRRFLSTALKSVIEHSQKTLLNIVGREIDASEAYAGFHDALFRMPPLSKDLILSCISELESLIDGIEALTQTEIEALTVVWEALKVSQKERRDFWGIIGKSKSSLELDDENPFSEKFSGPTCSSEEWMVGAVKSASDSYRMLKTRLKKLEGVNKEVERLRSKQDLKSQILSLDSEIRIMNAKLLDFEELKCNKQRLLSKKIGGTTLLKEERFRKQMQSKFLANLKQIVNLLRSWERKEKTRFDNSLLSDDVRELLKEEADQMENWVDMRTKLMRLRTVKAQVPKKKSNEDSSSSRRVALRNRSNESLAPNRRQIEKQNKRHVSSLTSPRKRTIPPMARGKSRDRKYDDHNNSEVRARNHDNDGERSPKRRKRKQDPVALPFGSILADSPNPKKRSNDCI